MTAFAPATIVRNLRGAADVIDRNGLAKNGRFYDGTSGKPPRDCPVCVYGALDVADGRDPGTGRLGTVSSEAGREFVHYLGKNVTAWNDAPETTADEVTAALRDCAKWLERSV